jgi:hypothetical protein
MAAEGPIGCHLVVASATVAAPDRSNLSLAAITAAMG